MTPVVSILMPVLNARRFLPACLEGILAQSLEDWELVAVDDGSTDGSLEWLRAAAKDDRRVRPVAREHAGIAGALNAGLAHCRGEWIARMDSDDRMLARRLELQMSFAEASPEVAIIGGLVAHRPGGSAMANTTGMRRFIDWVNSLVTPEQIAREMFVDCPVPHPTFFMRRQVLLGCGGYTSEPVPEDYDLVLRLHFRGALFAKVPETIVEWTDHPGRATRADPLYAPHNFSLLKVRHLAQQHLAGGRAFYVWGAGDVGKRFVRALQNQGMQPEALIDIDPRKIGQTIYGRPVWGPEELSARWAAGSLVICAVGAPGAREDIRSWMSSLGRTEVQDFVFAA